MLHLDQQKKYGGDVIKDMNMKHKFIIEKMVEDVHIAQIEKY